MKYLVLLIIIVIGGYFYPQISTSTSGPCQALEIKIVDAIRAEDRNAGLIAGLVSGVSDGELGRQLAMREYPDLPTSIACVRGYYSIDPENIR